MEPMTGFAVVTTDRMPVVTSALVFQASFPVSDGKTKPAKEPA